jgi:putative spermidine/putrescine transport system permease protein
MSRTDNRNRRSHAALGKRNWWPKLLLGALLLYLFLPVLATLLFSIARNWQSGILPSSYTLRWYADLFGDARFLAAVGRTVFTGLLTVVAGLVVLVPVIFVLVVYFPRWEKLLQALTLLPFAFPPVVTAIGLIRLYSSGPLPLTGTIWILIGVYLILIQPFLYQSVRNSLLAIRAKELMEAAEVLGAGRWTGFLRIILPNILPGTLVASLLSFSMVFGEFVMANMLVGGQYETVQIFLFQQLKQNGQTGSAVVLTYFAVVLLLSGLVLKLGKWKPQGYVAPAARKGKKHERYPHRKAEQIV